MAFFKKRQKEEAPKPQRMNEYLSFRVTGTSYDNEDGTKREEIINSIAAEFKNIGEKSDFYGGYTDKEIREDDLSIGEYEGFNLPIELEEYEFKNSPAFRVITDNGCVGVVPAKIVPELKEKLDEEWQRIGINATLEGGKVKSVDYSDSEKGKIIIEEEPLSIMVDLTFYPKQE